MLIKSSFPLKGYYKYIFFIRQIFEMCKNLRISVVQCSGFPFQSTDIRVGFIEKVPLYKVPVLPNSVKSQEPIVCGTKKSGNPST